MKIFFVFITVFCVAVSATYYDYYRHKTPPPGYGIACDGKGHFTVMLLGKSQINGFNFDTICEGAVESSRQEIINKEWRWYEYDLKPHTPLPHYDFHNCSKD